MGTTTEGLHTVSLKTSIFTEFRAIARTTPSFRRIMIMAVVRILFLPEHVFLCVYLAVIILFCYLLVSYSSHNS